MNNASKNKRTNINQNCQNKSKKIFNKKMNILKFTPIMKRENIISNIKMSKRMYKRNQLKFKQISLPLNR